MFIHISIVWMEYTNHKVFMIRRLELLFFELMMKLKKYCFPDKKEMEPMLDLTPALMQFLFTCHRDLLLPITFGQLRYFTDEIREEYIRWRETEEGKKYLPGGECYYDDGISARFDGGLPT